MFNFNFSLIMYENRITHLMNIELIRKIRAPLYLKILMNN